MSLSVRDAQRRQARAGQRVGAAPARERLELQPAPRVVLEDRGVAPEARAPARRRDRLRRPRSARSGAARETSARCRSAVSSCAAASVRIVPDDVAELRPAHARQPPERRVRARPLAPQPRLLARRDPPGQPRHPQRRLDRRRTPRRTPARPGAAARPRADAPRSRRTRRFSAGRRSSTSTGAGARRLRPRSGAIGGPAPRDENCHQQGRPPLHRLTMPANPER